MRWVNPALALGDDATSRSVAERRAARPDALLEMNQIDTEYTPGSPRWTYALRLRTADGATIWRARFDFRPPLGRGCNGPSADLARMLVERMAADGVLRPCPASLDMRRRRVLRRLRRPLLAGLVLLTGCGRTTVDLQSNRSEGWTGHHSRLLVLLGREMGAGLDADAFGSALQQRLAGCGVTAEVIVPPPNADIALDGDVAARRLREHERVLRPDALLTMRRASRRSQSGAVTVTYDLRLLRLQDRKAAWRAQAALRPSGGPRWTTPDFARLLVAHLARDGVIRPCPAQPVS